MAVSSKPYYSNCIYQTWWAVISGRCPVLYLVKSASKVWPWHLVIQLRQGRFIQFVTVDRKADIWGPWWFRGQWRGTSLRAVERRGIIYRTKVFWEKLAITTLLFCIGFPILFFLWILYQPFYALNGLIQAIIKRTKRI